MTITLYLGGSPVKLSYGFIKVDDMIKRIHPKIKAVPEYDPFKDEKIIDLGQYERMNVRQALTVAYNTDLLDIILLGNCGCGCGLIKIITSSMTIADMLMLAEKLKMAVMDRELTHDESDRYNPEEAG